MDVVGGVQITKKEHDYIFMVVDRFNNDLSFIMKEIKVMEGNEIHKKIHKRESSVIW